jgi:hypothetical protein
MAALIGIGRLVAKAPTAAAVQLEAAAERGPAGSAHLGLSIDLRGWRSVLESETTIAKEPSSFQHSIYVPEDADGESPVQLFLAASATNSTRMDLTWADLRPVHDDLVRAAVAALDGADVELRGLYGCVEFIIRGQNALRCGVDIRVGGKRETAVTCLWNDLDRLVFGFLLDRKARQGLMPVLLNRFFSIGLVQ